MTDEPLETDGRSYAHFMATNYSPWPTVFGVMEENGSTWTPKTRATVLPPPFDWTSASLMVSIGDPLPSPDDDPYPPEE